MILSHQGRPRKSPQCALVTLVNVRFKTTFAAKNSEAQSTAQFMSREVISMNILASIAGMFFNTSLRLTKFETFSNAAGALRGIDVKKQYELNLRP